MGCGGTKKAPRNSAVPFFGGPAAVPRLPANIRNIFRKNLKIPLNKPRRNAIFVL